MVVRQPGIHDEMHELPLAYRLVDEAVAEWLRTHLDLARAGHGDATPIERAKQRMIDEIQYLALAGFSYQLTPAILDALGRAGLLADERRGGE